MRGTAEEIRDQGTPPSADMSKLRHVFDLLSQQLAAGMAEEGRADGDAQVGEVQEQLEGTNLDSVD